MIQAEDWRPADGLILEPNALSAAKEEARCLALTAGPGAGKTEVLAQRADFLLRTGLCRYPKRILAISFKVDASRNLNDRVRRRCGTSLAARFDSYTFHAFAKHIIDRFRLILTGRDALDPDYQIGPQRITRKQITFGELVPFAVDILRNSAIARNAVRQTYSHVFLDEFQDCTREQYQLIQQAFKGTNIPLTAVGDTKQLIMEWAGAVEGIFQSFSEDFDVLGLNLYANFRSQPRLRRMQNLMIRKMDPAAALPDEAIVGDGGEISIETFDGSQQEAEVLAEMIHEWISGEGLPPTEIAVLISKESDYYAELLMRELENLRVPYRNEQKLQDISVEPIARLIVDFLSVLYGNREPGAYVRLMDLLIEISFDEDDMATQRDDWQRYIRNERVELFPLTANNTSLEHVWEQVIKFLRKVGRPRLVSLSADYGQGSRLITLVQDTKARISELLDVEPNVARALACFSTDCAVRIMTIHKCKGLEFDSVIMLGVENETFWGAEKAERNAYFVGISRAKRRLVLTCTTARSLPTDYPRPRQWKTQRSPQEEFLGYALPFVTTGGRT